jgi:Mn2+/Fe2+ NRAMP family transporter
VTRVRCLRTLLLAPVLYVNQEMVLRLGAVTGVGHARLILERFGKFWGAFSVIDLFLLNALTIVTGCVRTEVWPAARPAASLRRK